MYYFRFEIPTNTDGSRVIYSPGYHGTIPHCPKDVKVLLYNDKEGYGIAQTEDKFIPKEVTVIEEAEALGTLTEFIDTKEEDIYIGDKIVTRWDEVEVVDGLPLDFDAGFGVSPDVIITDPALMPDSLKEVLDVQSK